MQKREANCQTYFNKWVKNVYKKTAVFELKQTQGDSIPFSDVVPHQIAALEQVRNGTFVYKIPDAGFQNPFDSFCLARVPAYVVFFYPHSFHLISINTFLLEKSRSKRKSLTEKRAFDISVKSVKI